MIVAALAVFVLLLWVSVIIFSYIGLGGWKYHLGYRLPLAGATPRVPQDPAIADEQRLRVLNAIAHAGSNGSTDADLAGSIRMLLDIERVYRSELVKRGFVEDSGQRRSWALGSDAAGTLWRITGQGRAELNERLSQPHGTGAEEGGTAAS